MHQRFNSLWMGREYCDTFPAGTKVMPKMAYGLERITAFGKV